jgi:hypothetical protein
MHAMTSASRCCSAQKSAAVYIYSNTLIIAILMVTPDRTGLIVDEIIQE